MMKMASGLRFLGMFLSLLATSGRFKSYRSGRSRIILRARSVSMTFFLSGNSSCISFAVVRSTLLLLDFSSEYFVLS